MKRKLLILVFSLFVYGAMGQGKIKQLNKKRSVLYRTIPEYYSKFHKYPNTFEDVKRFLLNKDSTYYSVLNSIEGEIEYRIENKNFNQYLNGEFLFGDSIKDSCSFIFWDVKKVDFSFFIKRSNHLSYVGDSLNDDLKSQLKLIIKSNLKEHIKPILVEGIVMPELGTKEPFALFYEYNEHIGISTKCNVCIEDYDTNVLNMPKFMNSLNTDIEKLSTKNGINKINFYLILKYRKRKM